MLEKDRPCGVPNDESDQLLAGGHWLAKEGRVAVMPTALALAKSSSSASASDLPKGSSNTRVQYSASFNSMTVTDPAFGVSAVLGLSAVLGRSVMSGAGAVGDTGTDKGSIVAPDVVCRVGVTRCYGMMEIKNQIQSRAVSNSRGR